MLCEDVKNQLRAINHPPMNHALNIPLLRRSQIMIEKNQIGIHRCGCTSNFFQLAFANESGRIWPVTTLQKFAGNIRAGTHCQSFEFIKGFFSAELWDAWWNSGNGSTGQCAITRGLCSGSYRLFFGSPTRSVFNSDQESAFRHFSGSRHWLCATQRVRLIGQSGIATTQADAP
jgi:hypothetical protein